MSNWFWLSKNTLRVRLTAWYLLLLGLILLLFSSFVGYHLKSSLLSQLDGALKLTALYAINELEVTEGRPVFDSENLHLSEYFSNKGTAARFIDLNGRVWDGLGSYKAVPLWLPKTSGYKSITGNNTFWRIYSQPISSIEGFTDEEYVGWIQIAQSFTPIQEVEEDFLEQIFFSFPVLLSIVGLGGWFLLNQAIRPIEHLTRTAEEISAGNLNRRIDYRGPADEVGRLAMTFNQMLDRIQAAFDRERRFSADVSHELRTPLTTIKGQIDVSLSRQRQQADYEKTLQRIEKEVDRLIRLTNDLLFLERLDRDRLSCQTDKLKLRDFLEAIVEQVQPLAESKEIELIVDVGPSLSIWGDPDRLIRVFLNLLDNAIKYTPTAGKVSVLAKEQGMEVQIIIQDTGPGIAPEHIPHLFERFYRVEQARDRQCGGSGLGLAIAYELVRLQGGSLKVQSILNRGSRFIVSLKTVFREDG